MDLETWFAPALELGKLVSLYQMAEPEEQVRLSDQIEHCAHITRLHGIQSNSSTDFLRSNCYKEVNSIRRDYFISPCVPTYSTAPDKRIPMSYHRHDYFELVFVLRGSYGQTINGVLHRFGQGDICMMNPDIIHRDENADPDDRVLFMGLSCPFLQGDLMHSFEAHPTIAAFFRSRQEDSDVQYIRFHTQNFQAVQELLMQILEEDEAKQAGHHLVIKGYLVRMFKMLIDGGQYTLCRQTKKEGDQALYKEILEYMQTHLSDIKRTEAAAYFHFNPDYLNRFLIRNGGENYSALLTRMRMETAAYQLEHTEKSIAQIISELGFSNRGHFNHLFVQKYGMLPGKFREER